MTFQSLYQRPIGQDPGNSVQVSSRDSEDGFITPGSNSALQRRRQVLLVFLNH